MEVGPPPNVNFKNWDRLPARLVTKNVGCSPGVASNSTVLRFHVLSNRSRWRPSAISLVTDSPSISRAISSPSRTAVTSRCFRSSDDVRVIVRQLTIWGCWTSDIVHSPSPQSDLSLHKILSEHGTLIISAKESPEFTQPWGRQVLERHARSQTPSPPDRRFRPTEILSCW